MRPAILALSALAAFSWTLVWGAEGNAADDDAETLRRMTEELLDAVAPGDAALWETYLHDDLIHMDENGIIRGKAELVSEIRPLPPGLTGELSVDVFEARIFADFAVTAHEDQESLDYFGQHLGSRFRSVDTWKRTPEGWRLVGMHVAAVLRDPPSIDLPQASLCAYNGVYRLTEEIETAIACDGNGLTSKRTGRPVALFKAEAPDVFFEEGRPRTRRLFQRDADGQIAGFVDRREGEDIAWRRADP